MAFMTPQDTSSTNHLPIVSVYQYLCGAITGTAYVRPLYLNSQLLSLLFDAQASELSSRMTAMKAATDNAKELLGDETREGRREGVLLVGGGMKIDEGVQFFCLLSGLLRGHS